VTTTMTSDIEQKHLELVANAVEFENMMYVRTCLSLRLGLSYEREYERISAWAPLDDGDLFCLTKAAPLFDLHRITYSASGSGQQNLDIRCVYMRESFVQVAAKTVVDSLLAGGSRGVLETLAVGECQK